MLNTEDTRDLNELLNAIESIKYNNNFSKDEMVKMLSKLYNIKGIDDTVEIYSIDKLKEIFFENRKYNLIVKYPYIYRVLINDFIKESSVFQMYMGELKNFKKNYSENMLTKIKDIFTKDGDIDLCNIIPPIFIGKVFDHYIDKDNNLLVLVAIDDSIYMKI